ncbi:MAG: Na+-dependent transporter [Polyangiaceae bacterium]|nr:Na+-dependent transporter [Polyangiaceae bacterium]
MTAAQWLMLALKASIVLIVVPVGLMGTLQDATSLLRRPGALLRSMVAMNVLMPVLAVLLALSFALDPVVKVALIALSVSPMPPFLPKKAAKAGGEGGYTVGLLVAASVLSLVLVPVAMSLIGRIFHIEVSVPIGKIVGIVVTTVLAPLAFGLVVRRLAPNLAERAAHPVSVAAGVLLVGSALPLLVVSWPAMKTLIGNGTLAAMVVFAVAGVVAGHFLGGPREDERVVLAMATGSRHPAVAIALGTAYFADSKQLIAAVLLYLVVCTIAVAPYLGWRRRHLADTRKLIEERHHEQARA